ncbi:MAG: PQQ-binding-like beta-propeller repeat protein [Anaerolineae bacterium]
MSRTRFILSVLLFALIATFIVPPVKAQSTTTLLYRGSAGRTGVYDLPAVPALRGLAWKSSVGEAGFSSPIYAAGSVFIGTNRGELKAFDAATGDQQWNFSKAGGNASPPAYADGVVYAGLGIVEGRMGLYALDARTGDQLWLFATDSPIWLSAPLIHDGAAIFGDQNGVLYSVDLISHKERWRADKRGAVLWFAAAEGDSIYFTAGSILYALDAASGDERWNVRLSSDWMPLAVADGTVYAGDARNSLHALDAATGEEVWTFKDRVTSRGSWSAPTINDGVVYAGNRTGFFYAFNAKTGEQLWKFDAQAPATSDAVLANGILYFGVGAHGSTSADQTKAYFYALDAATGAEVWKFEADGEIFNGPAISEDQIYFVTAANDLYALR